MGTEAFWVPAAIAAVSAGAQAVNSRNATQRGQNAEVTALQDQNNYRNQANNLVKQQTQSIATSNPGAIANTEESQFVNNLRKNEAGTAAGGSSNTNANTFGQPVSALAPTPGASKAYNKSAANSQQETQQYGNTEAGEESAVDAAVRQRQNEGLQMQTLGTNLNTINAQSQLQGFVDQLRARTVSQQSPWVSLFSTLGNQGASTMSKNGFFTAAPAAANNTIPAGTFLGNGGFGGSYPAINPPAAPQLYSVS